jgi:hypothetical protein
MRLTSRPLVLLVPLLLVVAAGSRAPAAGSRSVAATAAPAAASTPLCGWPVPKTASPPHHVVVIFMENESRSSVIGDHDAPYQTSLAAGCGQATAMYGVTHPSLPNYLALQSGVEKLGTFHDCVPKPAKGACVSASDNIFHQLDAAGMTWRTYAESMTTNCQLTPKGIYFPRHNPAVYFTDLTAHTSGETGACPRDDVPMGDLSTQTGQFYTDLKAGNLPDYSFITPNAVDDAHNSDTKTGDTYLSELIPVITAGPNYRAGDTDIVITYDEGGGRDSKVDEDCTNEQRDQAGAQPSCNIPFLVLAPYERPGTVDSDFCTLYCLTQTIEATFRLPLLGHAGDSGSRDLADAFNLAPGTAR